MTEERKEKRRIALQKWRRNNPDKVAAQSRRARDRHPDLMRKRALDYYYANREKALAKNREYCKAHRHEINVRVESQRRTNPQRRIKSIDSHRIWETIRLSKFSPKINSFLGCSRNEFLRWIESQFRVGMSWKNYGDWEIDHKVPCSNFDLTDPVQRKACNHFTNLQPLWARENREKGSKHPA